LLFEAGGRGFSGRTIGSFWGIQRGKFCEDEEVFQKDNEEDSEDDQVGDEGRLRVCRSFSKSKPFSLRAARPFWF
jgi:hypothetical protein